jgi:hypothetical protein
MAYLYTTYIAVTDKDNRYKNFASTPTITVYDGVDASVIATPSPTITNLGVGLYKLSITIADLTDVLFQVVPPVADQADIGDLTTLYDKVIHTVDDNLDVAVSTRSSHTAADVWTSATRTLTSFGTLAADVWAATVRTLTQPAAQVIASVSGSSLSLTNRVSFAATLTGLTIPANWEAVYLTVKRTTRDADADAILQIIESNPSDPADGVTRYAGAAPTALQIGYAGLTVDQAGGTIAIRIDDDLSFADYVGSNSYDVKCLLDDGTSVLLASSSLFTIALTETRTV